MVLPDLGDEEGVGGSSAEHPGSDNTGLVYLSFHPDDAEVASAVCAALATRGFRFTDGGDVGGHFDASRIE